MNESDIALALELRRKSKSGANWFFWIAGLSILNSIILLTGGGWSFIFGLGITQMVDGFVFDASTGGKLLGLLVNLMLAGVFVFFGAIARKRETWAFVVGMVLYAFDGLLFLLFTDWLSVGFHAFALFSIFGGLKALKRLKELDPHDQLERQLQEAKQQQSDPPSQGNRQVGDQLY